MPFTIYILEGADQNTPTLRRMRDWRSEFHNVDGALMELFTDPFGATHRTGGMWTDHEPCPTILLVGPIQRRLVALHETIYDLSMDEDLRLTIPLYAEVAEYAQTYLNVLLDHPNGFVHISH